MDKSSDDSSKAKGTMIKVKFKGSKLATGSSKMPSAVVTSYFMNKLTPLNISIMGGTPVVPAKKKQKSEDIDRTDEDSDRLRRRRVTIAANSTDELLPPQPQLPSPPPPPSEVFSAVECSALVPNIKSQPTPLSTVRTLNIEPVSSTGIVIAGAARPEASAKDWTVGGLSLPATGVPSTSLSALHAQRHNRKHFLKMVEAIDPAEMDVTCDFDFWLWLDAQKLFAPFSYKTHDLSVLALQDIGKEEVLSRWAAPSLVPSALTAAGAATDIAAGASTVTGSVSLRLHDHVSSEGDQPACAAPPPTGTGQNGNCAYLMNGCVDSGCDVHSGNGSNNGGGSSSSSSSAGVRRRQEWCDLSRGVDDAADPIAPPLAPHTLSATLTATDTAAQGALLAGLAGLPRPELVCGASAGVGAAGAAGARSADQGGTGAQPLLAAMLDDKSPSIDSYLQELREELLCTNLEVNNNIARLRRDCLQSPALRGELEANTKQLDREKAVITKWRKSKSFLASLNNNYPNGGNSTNAANGGGGGNGTHGKAKASHHHKKKLGTY